MSGTVELTATSLAATGVEALKSLSGSLGVLSTPHPGSFTSLAASSGNVANATADATLAAAAGLINYVSTITITAAGATAASNKVATLSGLVGGATLSFIVAVPAGATTAIYPIVVTFDPPIPANAANTAITLSLPALGAGNTHAATSIHGFRATV